LVSPPRKPWLQLRWLEWSIIGLVLAQMLLGIVLAHVGIVRVAQVLHIGLSSLLVSGLFFGCWVAGAPSWLSSSSMPEPDDAKATHTTMSDLLTLTKLRLSALVIVTTFVGFWLAAPRPMPWLLLLHTIIGGVAGRVWCGCVQSTDGDRA